MAPSGPVTSSLDPVQDLHSGEANLMENGMRFFLLLAVVALLWVSGPATAEAQGWRQVYKDAQVTVSLDTSRITRSPESYTVILRWNYTSQRFAENRKPYVRMIQQVRVACTPAPLRVKRFAAALYTETGVLVEEAKPLSAGELQYMDWERPPARSEGSRVYPALCRTLASRPAPRRA